MVLFLPCGKCRDGDEDGGLVEVEGGEVERFVFNDKLFRGGCAVE
jgi:hypothetical protein